ncbi:MAG: TIM barrel protein [Bacteroidales bacterium]|nr:TIM barrel protein [Bacteroidales bacterium]
MTISRRSFIKTGAAGALMLTAGGLDAAASACISPKKKAAKTEDKFHLGAAGYTFVKFDLDTALKTLQRADVHYLCIKDFHLPLNATDDQIAAFHAKCASYGVTGYGVGPIYMETEAEADRAFAYARRVGVKVLVGVPSYEILPYVDKKLEEYPEIKYAIHLHGPDINIFQTASVIWDKVKDLNPRLGMCLDVGHDLRGGADPVEDLKKYHTRVFDMHFKDESEASKAGWCVEIGRGKIDFPALVRMMRKVGYSGVCSLEYEKDMDDPFMGIAESFGYLKAVIANS